MIKGYDIYVYDYCDAFQAISGRDKLITFYSEQHMLSARP